METTRHFVATVYAVNDGAVALHHHDKLDMWLPAGGHVELDELPHEAAKREAKEELGLAVDLLAPVDDLSSSTAQSIPKPQHFLLEDINVAGGEVGHQHADFVYYGRVESRDIDPEPGEAAPEVWEWIEKADLGSWADDLPADVLEASRRAIEAVEQK